MNRQCLVFRLGIIDYQEALRIQWQLARARTGGEVSDTLVLLQHPHTITLGRGGKRKGLLMDEGLLMRQGIAFYEVDRGGDITYHGPGQLVGYPILDLKNHGQNIHLYLRRLEEAIILTLNGFGISPSRREGLTGVWVGGEKIASIGIHVGGWVSWHGFALNVNTDLSYFDLIIPCGIEGAKMTSMAKLLGREVNIEKVIDSLVPIFGEVFQVVVFPSSLPSPLRGEGEVKVSSPRWGEGSGEGGGQAKMKAMVLRNPGLIEGNPLEWSELSLPAPGPEEVRIQVQACGLCRTDLHTVEGELPLSRLPVIPGHQIVGVVESIGRDVTRFREGEQVVVPWLNYTCGSCDMCQRGKENLCEAARFTGYHVDGGYAQYTVVSEAFAYPMPAGFSDIEAAPLLCAGVIGFRALRLSEMRPGECLGLYGFGASAHIVIQVARYWGCEVYVFTRSEEHRQLARQLGAAWAGRAEDEPPGKLDSAIIFAPAGRLVLDALRVLRKGGTLALAGIYMSPIPEMDYTLLYHERTIRSVANSTRQDVLDMLELAVKVPVRTEVQVFSLEEANRALQLLKNGKIQGAGVLKI